MGLILGLVVHAANVQDRDGAKQVLGQLTRGFPRLKRIWADGGYSGKLVAWAMDLGQWVLEIIKRNTELHHFEVLPKRWIVERTFAWLGRHRRLSKDYETLLNSSEATVYLAMINVMIHRLRPG